jgi:hypothetical protein
VAQITCAHSALFAVWRSPIQGQLDSFRPHCEPCTIDSGDQGNRCQLSGYPLYAGQALSSPVIPSAVRPWGRSLKHAAPGGSRRIKPRRVRRRDATARVGRSFGETPKSIPATSLLAASAQSTPIASPTSASANVSRSTIQRMFSRSAPKATQMPISRVRRATA